MLSLPGSNIVLNVTEALPPLALHVLGNPPASRMSEVTPGQVAMGESPSTMSAGLRMSTFPEVLSLTLLVCTTKAPFSHPKPQFKSVSQSKATIESTHCRPQLRVPTAIHIALLTCAEHLILTTP
jgi:hypothetical protein